MSAAGRPRRCPDGVLEQVLRMRRAGATLATICLVLNEMQIATPGGGARWYPSHVSRLLHTRGAGLELDELRAQDRRRHS